MKKSQTGHWVLNFIEEESGNLNETPDPTSSKSPERHSEFFFDDTLVAIQVEEILFNVHKYQLVKSEVFSDMFKMPRPEGGTPEEGSSPDHPIKLKGVSASDFATLLRVLYASYFTSDPPAAEASLIIPTFRLANMFNFSQLRAFLLPLAEENLDDADKIVFAREFDFKHWLVPAHVRLCQREKPLSAEEVRKLGVESVVIISRMREQHRNRAPTPSYNIGTFYCDACVGFTRKTASRTCSGPSCEGDAHLRYQGTGRMAQGDTTTTDVAAIETEINKWEENGCITAD